MRNSSLKLRSDSDLERKVERRIASGLILAVVLVFIFSVGCFLMIRFFGRSQSPQMPLIQVKTNDEWAIIRMPDEWNNDVNVNMDSFDYCYNESTGQYDVTIHYNAR